MPGPSLGEAVLEVTADMSGFEASFQDSLKGAEASVKKSGDKIGTSLGDAVVKGADGRLRDSRGRFVKAGANLGTSLGDAITDSAQGEVKKSASRVATPLKDQTQKTVRELAANTARQFATLGKTIGTEFARAGRAAGKALANSPLGRAAKTIFTPIANAAATVRDRVVSAFTTIGTKVRGAFAWLGSIAGKAFAPIATAARKIGTTVTTAFDRVRSGAGTVFTKIGSAATTAFSGITTAAAKIRVPIRKVMDSSLGRQVQSSFTKIRTAASDAFGSLGPLAQKAFPAIGSAASTVFGKIGGFASRATSAIGSAFSKVQPAVGKALSGLGNITKSAFSKVGSIASSAMSKVMTGIKGLAIGVGAAAVAGVGATITKGFSRLTGIENAEASLKGLGYTAKEAANIINGPVMDAVKGTAFGLDEAAAAAQGALGAGVENGTALADYLTLVGDAASQAQVDFNSMAMIMNKVQGAGKLTGDTLQQMAENNLQVMPMLTKAYGKSQEEIQKMVSNGEISAKDFQRILQENIGGAAQKAGDTVTGAFRNMGAAMGRLGAKFLGGSFGQLKKVFTGVSNALDAIGPQAEKVGNALGKFIKPAADAIANFGKTAKEGGIGDALAAFSPVMTIVKAAIPVLSAFGSVFKNVVQDQMKSFGKALQSINPAPLIDVFTTIGNALTSVMYSIGKIDLGSILQPLLQGMTALLGVVPKILPPIMQLVSVLAGALGQILPVIAQGVAALAQIIGGVLAAALPPVINLITAVAKVIGDGLAKLLPVIIPLVQQLASFVGQWLATAIGVLADVLNVLISTLLPPLIDLFSAILPVIGQLAKALLPPLLQVFQALAPVLVPIITLLAKLVAAVLPLLVSLLNVLTPLLVKLAEGLGWVLGKVAQAITWFVKWVTTTGNVSKAFSSLRKNIGDVIAWIWGKLKGFASWVGSGFASIGKAILKPFTAAGKKIGEFWAGVRQKFSAGKDWVGSTWKNSWSKVSTWMSGAVSKGRDKIGNLWGKVQDRFSNARKWVGSSWRNSWSKVSEWMSNAVGKGRDKIGNLWSSARDKFSNARKWVGSSWRNNWSKVSGWMSNAVEKGRNKVGDAWKGARNRFSDARAWVKDHWRPNWSSVEDWMKNPVKNAKAAIERFLGREGVRKALTGFVTAAGKIFDGLKKAMGAPVQWVINNIMVPLSQKAASLGSKVGIKIPEVKPMSQFSKGGITGVVPGYTPGRDTHIVGVGGGEAIMRPEITRAVGTTWVHAANAAARAGGVQGAKRFLAESRYGEYAGGFAGGGVVQPVPGRGNRHTSGYPWATWAGDYPAGYGGTPPVKAWKDGIVAAVRHLTTSYGNHIRINHNDGSSSLYAHLSKTLVSIGDKVTAGQHIGNVGWSGNVRPRGPGGAHLHFETMGKPYNGGSGSGSSEAEEAQGFLSKIKELMNVALPDRFGKNTWTDMLIAIPKTIGKAAVDKLGSMIAAIGDGVMSGASWVGSKVAGLDAAQRKNAAVIIDVAKQLGFGDRGAIIGLITALVESGLRNVNYGDRDSLGLFQQRAPWGSAADRTNPSKATSMFFLGGQGGQPGLKSKNWRTGGLGALAQAVQVSAFPYRYSTQVPRARLILAAFKAGSKKYDDGGWVPPGISVMHNQTGSREPAAVFTTEQWQTLHQLASGQTRTRTAETDRPINIHLHGVIDSASAAREIEKLMVSRGRTVRGVDLPSRSRKVARGA